MANAIVTETSKAATKVSLRPKMQTMVSQSASSENVSEYTPNLAH